MFNGLKKLFSGARQDGNYDTHLAPIAKRARYRQIDARPNYKRRLSLQELAEWYKGYALIRRVVNLQANAVANRTPQFSGSNKKLYTDIFAQQRLILPMRSGVRWSLLFGFGACLIDVNDRMQLDQPLRIRQASRLQGLVPLDRRVLIPEDFTSGPNSEYFTAYSMGMNRIPIGRIHRSRLLIFDGEDTDIVTRLSNAGCGESFIDLLAYTLQSIFGGYESLAFILQTFGTRVYTVEDLDNLMASQPEQVAAKINNMDEFWHNTRLQAIDKKDTLDIKPLPLTGVPELFSVLLERLPIETGYPRTLLFGMSPSGSGLSNGGQSEREQWEGLIGESRTERLDQNMEYLLWVLSQIHGKPMPGWEYHPALPPDQERLLKARESQAKIDGMYSAMGVYGARTIQKNRFEGDYSFETEIHPDELGGPDEVDPNLMDPDQPDQEDLSRAPEQDPEDSNIE